MTRQTLQEIARRADVHPVTVAAYLAGLPGKSRVRERVKEALLALGIEVPEPEDTK